MPWTRLWCSQQGLGLWYTLAKLKACSVPMGLRGTWLVLNSPALGAEQLILSEMAQLTFQKDVMIGTLHVKCRAEEPRRIFKVFLDLFSAPTQVCYFCKCLMYFLSDFLRTRTTYSDGVPLTAVKNNVYYKMSAELGGVFSLKWSTRKGINTSRVLVKNGWQRNCYLWGGKNSVKWRAWKHMANRWGRDTSVTLMWINNWSFQRGIRNKCVINEKELNTVKKLKACIIKNEEWN